MILTHLQFDRYKHSKHPEELKSLKQSEFKQLLIASIDQFGLVMGNFDFPIVPGSDASASGHWHSGELEN